MAGVFFYPIGLRRRLEAAPNRKRGKRMIIIMKPQATEEQIGSLCQDLIRQGMQVQRNAGVDCTVLGVLGDVAKLDPHDFLIQPGVERVMPVSEPFKKANRKFHPTDSVIDCGGQEDASGETAARFLLARGVTQVDRLILTHFDADHCNGVRQLLRRVRVKTLYVPDVSPENNLRTKILFAAAQAGAEIRFVTNDLTLPDGMRMFAPTGSAEESNTGLCVLAAGEKYDILVTGDLSEQAEYRLLSTYALPRAAVLVAGHHGAATSTSEALLRAIRPEAVLISVGADNRFGHPADETLRRIEKAGAAVFRTDLSGTITIRG